MMAPSQTALQYSCWIEPSGCGPAANRVTKGPCAGKRTRMKSWGGRKYVRNTTVVFHYVTCMYIYMCNIFANATSHTSWSYADRSTSNLPPSASCDLPCRAPAAHPSPKSPSHTSDTYGNRKKRAPLHALHAEQITCLEWLFREAHLQHSFCVIAGHGRKPQVGNPHNVYPAPSAIDLPSV